MHGAAATRPRSSICWRLTDYDTADRLYFEPLTPEEEAAAEEFGRTLVTDRNAVMIRAADEALRAGKNVFYIVGIAHMLGEDSIVEGLRQLGYTVTQVSYTS